MSLKRSHKFRSILAEAFAAEDHAREKLRAAFEMILEAFDQEHEQRKMASNAKKKPPEVSKI